VQVLGMLSAEGLICMQRVTLDGTKIKANASGNTFRREEKLEAHLALAQEQVEAMNAQAGQEATVAKRQAAALLRAAQQRASRLEAALHEVQRLQPAKKHDRDQFTARASATDPEAHVMRNGEGATVPSYNVQLVTDYYPWVGRECRSNDRRHRLPPSGAGSSALQREARQARSS
jgi:multidrug efflux pump subunit AcrA (membrane-fusion protein)